MASKEAVDHVKRITEAAKAADPDDDAGSDLLPSWFGPDYAPTDEAIASFAELPKSASGSSDEDQAELFG